MGVVNKFPPTHTHKITCYLALSLCSTFFYFCVVFDAFPWHTVQILYSGVLTASARKDKHKVATHIPAE